MWRAVLFGGWFFFHVAFCFCARHLDVVAVWASSSYRSWSFARLRLNLAGRWLLLLQLAV